MQPSFYQPLYQPLRAGLLVSLSAAALVLPKAIAAQSSAGDSSSANTISTDTSRAQPFGLQSDLIQNRRPLDQRGVNVFEPPKRDGVPYRGQRITWGVAFAQEFQSLAHRNSAVPVLVDSTNVNALMPIGAGFNNSVANLYLDAQIADGIRVRMTTYMSSVRHPDTWVKDGYILIDRSPFDMPILNRIMQDVTVRVGQFETNYGDAHFRRSDNGQGMYNPFIGNLIMDAFTVEIGSEVYYRPPSGLIAMAGVTAGQDQGTVTDPGRRGPAYVAKLGFDRQATPALRTRLTGSLYTAAKSPENVLFSGDRAGSRYQYVLENTAADVTVNSWAGNIQPMFGARVTTAVLNPFVKYRGLEFFGNAERARGRDWGEPTTRTVDQYAADIVYRFFDDHFYVAARYNTVRGRLPDNPDAIRVNRVQGSAGWFLNRNMLLKTEFVRQTYQNFTVTDIRNGGRFKGFLIEATVGL